MKEPSGYVLESLREGPDFTLYRGRQNGNSSPVLAIALSGEHPLPQGLRRLEQEYSLAAELCILGTFHSSAPDGSRLLEIWRVVFPHDLLT